MINFFGRKCAAVCTLLQARDEIAQFYVLGSSSTWVRPEERFEKIGWRSCFKGITEVRHGNRMVW